jgi:hypothetical protein
VWQVFKRALRNLFWRSCARLRATYDPEMRPRPRRNAGAICAALFIAVAPARHVPALHDFTVCDSDWWEQLYAQYVGEAFAPPASHVDISAIARKQPALLQAEISRIAPQRKGVTDIYVVGIAGWADQDVFIKELDGALASLGAVLPIKDHTLRLINSRQTSATVPLATPRNFVAAVRAIGAVMDKNEDVLVLLMTSHGDRTGFALELPDDEIGDLTPQLVASTLHAQGIKNRVVIVSACYAGIFLPPLVNDNTIVMTAADAKSSSFGCAPEREWTYFGDAFFHQALVPGTDFQNAFNHARVLIEGWELMDHLPPSHPQGSFGAALVKRLSPLLAAPPASSDQ